MEYKNRRAKEQQESWREKVLHGQFIRQTAECAGEGRPRWLNNSGIKRETEALIQAAQEQAIRTNLIKVKIDKTRVDSKCRMCSKVDETINRLRELGIETSIEELQKIILQSARIFRKVLEN